MYEFIERWILLFSKLSMRSVQISMVRAIIIFIYNRQVKHGYYK